MTSNLLNYCVSCRRETKHSILFTKEESSSRDEDFHWSTEYQIIECNGCSSIQFREIYSHEEMVNYDEEGNEYSYNSIKCHPPYLLDHNLISNYYYIPERIRTVYLETIETFKSKSFLLAGVGFRAIIEAICIEEGIKGGNLEQKISNLLKKKLITEKESNRLHSIRFLGNDSIHDMVVPSDKKLYIVLGIVEHLLKNLYLIDKEAKSELDTIIDNYKDFIELVWFKVTSLKVGDEKTLKEILEKNTRRIDTANLLLFSQNLIQDINSNKITWLSIGQLKPIGSNPTNIQHFVKT